MTDSAVDGYCIHVTTLESGRKEGTYGWVEHTDAPSITGVTLRLGKRLDGSDYWRAWLDEMTLAKAHLRSVACDFGDSRYCCPPRAPS